MAVINVQNFTGNTNAYPERWNLQPRSPACGNTVLASDSAVILVTYDCIINYRGGPPVQNCAESKCVAPAFGLVLSVGLQVSVASTLQLTIDQGDGNFVNFLNPALAVPVSPPIFNFIVGLPGLFYVKINLTRTSGQSTTVVWHSNITPN